MKRLKEQIALLLCLLAVGSTSLFGCSDNEDVETDTTYVYTEYIDSTLINQTGELVNEVGFISQSKKVDSWTFDPLDFTKRPSIARSDIVYLTIGQKPDIYIDDDFPTVKVSGSYKYAYSIKITTEPTSRCLAYGIDHVFELTITEMESVPLD